MSRGGRKIVDDDMIYGTANQFGFIGTTNLDPKHDEDELHFKFEEP